MGCQSFGIEPSEVRCGLAEAAGIRAIQGEADSCDLNGLMDIAMLVEASGNHSSIVRFLGLMRSKSVIKIVGHSTAETTIPLEPVVLSGLTICGSCGQIGSDTYGTVLRSLELGIIDPALAITHRVDLSTFPKTVDWALGSDGFGKILVRADR